MAQISNVLVPIDFSACSTHALFEAAGLAQRVDATIHALHVIELPPYLAAEETVVKGDASEDSLAEYARRWVQDDLSQLEQLLDARGLRVPIKLRTGRARDEILAEASEGGYDLMVIGTHGRTGISRMLLGSVAEQLVRRSPCPVLTIRAPD